MAMGSYFSKGMNYGRQGELGHDELHKEAEEHIEEGNRLHELGERFEKDKVKLEDALDQIEASSIPAETKKAMRDRINSAIDELVAQYEKDVKEEEAQVHESLETLLEFINQTVDEYSKQADSLRGVTMDVASIDATSAADAGDAKKQELEQMKQEYVEELRLQMQQAEILERNIRARRMRG